MGFRMKGSQESNSISVLLLLIIVSSFWGCVQPSSTSSYARKPEAVSDGLSDRPVKETKSVGLFSEDPATRRYLPYVRKFSEKYGVDWLLVLAVMKQESKFSHDAVSHQGAYGLMQIMPVTQIELTEKMGVEEAISPRNNIKAGIYHLRSLYDFFGKSRDEDRIKLTLAAYNAGLGRIDDARKVARYLGNDPKSWSAVKDALPFLSSRNYSLHKNIWSDGQPQNGYLRNWKQTVSYVENVLQFREELMLSQD